MCPGVAEYFLKCLPKLHPRRHYCLFLPVCSAEGGAVLIHQCSRTRAPRFFACFAGCPLAIRTRKTLLFTRAIRNTIECTLRGHSIVMNRAFGVACFSFFISLADPRSALPRLLRRLSARYPHEKNVTVHPRHSQNRAFGVACFSFVLGTLYPRWVLTSTKLLVQYRKFC